MIDGERRWVADRMRWVIRSEGALLHDRHMLLGSGRPV
jgi:hypothetical protein